MEKSLQAPIATDQKKVNGCAELTGISTSERPPTEPTSITPSCPFPFLSLGLRPPPLPSHPSLLPPSFVALCTSPHILFDPMRHLPRHPKPHAIYTAFAFVSVLDLNITPRSAHVHFALNGHLSPLCSSLPPIYRLCIHFPPFGTRRFIPYIASTLPALNPGHVNLIV